MNQELSFFLSGRLLLEEEVPFSLKDQPVEFLQGVFKENNQYRCSRCGNNEPFLFASFPCARCGQSCTYCRNCLMMGRVSECSQLVRWTGPTPVKREDGRLHWEGKLSKGQLTASDAVIEAVQQQSDTLIWAVCGAGKTEVLFRGIEAALKAQKRVCIATPRTDVVLELVPRLQKVFPEIEISALYGGSPDRHKYSSLVVTTTHQLFRFQEAFDVMIVDEVDAFPYSYDSTLQFAVHKARKPHSALIYLTATPNAQWQLECQTGKRQHTKIPARFHRYPLPVPEMLWCGRWQKLFLKGNIPPKVEEWVKSRLTLDKQALLFFPHIDVMEQALPLFQRLDPRIEAVHAEDPDRKEKVALMREKKLPVLLTTTILERGVTFPNIDVAVIGAEDDVFTESALVQIAGRVGRSADFPNGVVTFFHFGRTKAMLRAIAHIEAMNKEGRSRGLIDG
ncbi:DEAD/DEAH box helicase [Bacillus sp. FJAT-42315]|uniref:DEAD/DEAH box helicase n=1 Tax=Bacillus sp. FJAT-42315 TaxID=2014077 RepID=UPI000C239BEE|nr:DEAD/DEAH box helicase [Bacillus sp. FJAT-42315]